MARIHKKQLQEKIKKFVFLLCILTVGEAYDDNCLKCEDLNRQSSIKCPVNIADCGDCISGFIPDYNNPNFCFSLKVWPIMAMVIEEDKGQLIELPCEFNSKVECVWEKNGQPVNVDDNLRYLFKAKGTNAATPAVDCSLIIEDLNAIDAGEWQCGSKTTSSSTISVKSALITVILKGQSTTTKITLSESGATETSGENKAIHIYMDGQIVDRRAISMAKIRNGSEVECRADVVVDELRWETDGQLIAKISNANSVRIKSQDLDGHFETRNWPFAKVFCVAVKNGYKDSYVLITNTEVVSVEDYDNNMSPATKTIIIFVPCAVIVLIVLFLYARR